MRSQLKAQGLEPVFHALLIISVHFDAFRFAPREYLTAVKWWFKRKRVRARGQFAILLSQSPRAYQLWIKRQAISRDRQKVKTFNRNDRMIIAVIEMSSNCNPKDIKTTLECTKAEGFRVLMLESAETATLNDLVNNIDWLEAPWLIPLVPGDKVALGSGDVYRNMMAHSASRIIYADDDLLINRSRTWPHFKPDWNAELFAHFDYISGACMLRPDREDLEAVVGMSDWAKQLVARLVGKTEPLHLREMLHHRRYRPIQRLPVQPLRLGADLPPLTVIIPTRNRVDMLRTCLEGVWATDYPGIDVIIVDNDSDQPETLAFLAALDPFRHKVLRYNGSFNYSAINNQAVKLASGKLLCLLNNDIEMLDSNWLATMATQALRPEVGAVGARLLYPDGRIQHAGVTIGIGNAAGHAHRLLWPDEEGYLHRHSLPQFTMAVTAACLVVDRAKFLAVGGLNEHDFPVAFNDVDLCLRLNRQGWQSLYEPRATLIHHESVSRGLDRDPIGAARFARELAALQRIWKTDEVYDPYHHPHLSRASERFVVSL